MSIRAVAFVPSAPLLIPALAGGSAGLDEELRAASLQAVAAVLASRPDEVVVVAAALPGEWSADSTWDFSGFGVARAAPDPRPTLPWALGIGAWMLDECGWDGPRRYLGVQATSGPVGEDLPGDGVRAVVVVGDGSARLSERAPGHLDERAEAFDGVVADLLACGDAAGLGRLDPALAEELMCAGLPAWRWVGATLAGVAVPAAELVLHVAPYGVGYFVARWSLA